MLYICKHFRRSLFHSYLYTMLKKEYERKKGVDTSTGFCPRHKKMPLRKGMGRQTQKKKHSGAYSLWKSIKCEESANGCWYRRIVYSRLTAVQAILGGRRGIRAQGQDLDQKSREAVKAKSSFRRKRYVQCIGRANLILPHLGVAIMGDAVLAVAVAEGHCYHDRWQH